MIRAYRSTMYAVKETCAFGDEHEVVYFEVVELADTGKTVPCNNGYTVQTEHIMVDAEGREYESRHSIDYYGGTYYFPVKMGDGSGLITRLPQYARDTNGQPLTKKTPAGPALQKEVTWAWAPS